jgi:hypothetical protein
LRSVVNIYFHCLTSAVTYQICKSSLEDADKRGESDKSDPELKEKGQKDKQRSTKHTHKTKDRVTRIPLKTGGELRCSGRVGSSCSTSNTRRANL